MEVVEIDIGGHGAAVSVPVAEGVEEDVDVGGELEGGLGVGAEGDFCAEEVAGLVGGVHGGRRREGDERAVIEDLGAGVGGAMEEFFAFDVGLEDIMQEGHEGDLGLEFGEVGPDLGLGAVDGIDGEGEAVIVVGHVEGGASADLFEVADALSLFGGPFGSGEDGKQEGGEDRDDGDDHQEFDEGESLWFLSHDKLMIRQNTLSRAFNELVGIVGTSEGADTF